MGLSSLQGTSWITDVEAAFEWVHHPLQTQSPPKVMGFDSFRRAALPLRSLCVTLLGEKQGPRHCSGRSPWPAATNPRRLDRIVDQPEQVKASAEV